MIVGFVLFIGLMATMFIIYNPPSDKEIASYQCQTTSLSTPQTTRSWTQG